METKRLLASLTFSLLLSLALGGLAYADGPGDLDPTFGSDGKVTTDWGSGNSKGWAAALQPDGKIIVVGSSYNRANSDFTLARYQSNGSLDPAFGNNGSVITPLGDRDDVAKAVALQADGKIVVAGYSEDSNSERHFAVVRYNSDGSLDSSFNADQPPGQLAEANAVAIQLDGKIVAAGSTDNDGGTSDFALARYHPDGSLDANFGDDGQVITSIGSSFDYATALALQANGKIIAAGNSDNPESSTLDFALARYDENGNLDTTFDSDGKVTTNLGDWDYLAAIALQPNNRIVAAGSRFNWNGRDFALVRYRSNGSLDTTFDSDGWVTTDFDGNFDAATAVALYADGRIMAGGVSESSGGSDFALARYSSDGSLDSTFDGDGRVITGFANNVSIARAVLLQGDGQIVAAGHDSLTFALARYNNNGSLDATFDDDGQVTTPLGNSTDYSRAIALQPDGKIIVAGAGHASDPAGYDPYRSNGDFALVRYNSDGSLDSTFDGDGKVTTDFGGNGDRAHAILVQPDHKIILVGSNLNYPGDEPTSDFALARYTSNGSLDSTFGTDGQVTTSFDFYALAVAAVLQPDGKIVAAGSRVDYVEFNTKFTLVRYQSNGNLDPTFGDDGQVTTNFGNDFERANSLALQTDGKIVAAGSTDNGATSDFALARYNSDGALDSTFDEDGRVTTDFDGFDQANAIAVQDDGKIVVAGSIDNESTSDFALARYNSDGTLDSTFNEDGRVITDFDGSGQATAIALQADGKIVVVGYGEVINLNRSGFIVVRYRSDGSLDSTFGDGGVVITSINNNNDEAHAVALQPNGQIVVAGQSNDDFAVVRYRGDGAALTLSKTASVTTAQVGQTITYTYRVTNTGSIALTGLTANDDKLGQVSLGQTDLALNESTSGVLTYTVLASDRPGPLVNTVVASGAPPGDSVVTATATISVAVQPDLTQTTTMYLPSILK